MSTSNLKIWQAVEKTDPQFTKKFSVNGYSGTALSGQYIYMRLTEVFGPAGIGWGHRIVEERYDEGAPFMFGEQVMFEKTHTIRVQLWYLQDGQRGEIEEFGHTQYLYQKADKSRIIVDSEAPKKSLTDAIKKCASLLGVGADIYMGLHDLPEYVNELANESALEKAEDKVAEQERQAKERVEWMETTIRLIETCNRPHELGIIYKGAIRKLDLRKDERGKIAITKAFDKRKAELGAQKADEESAA